MINRPSWIAFALALTQPLAAGAQAPPAAETDKKKSTARLRPVASKPAPAEAPSTKERYWAASAEEGKPGVESDPMQSPPAAQAGAADVPGIADNSFLIEEAYNQEYGVVQHISTFSRAIRDDGWDYSFTQEWPFNPAPKSQLSYTVTGTAGGVPGARGGFGDTLLNYRYQLLGEGEDRVWFSPRASLLVPTGSSRRGRGAGGVGMQFNLPVSWQVADKLVTHWNAGTTIVPRAKNELGEKATTFGYFLGQSFIYEVSARFNLMLETVFDSSQSVVAPDRTMWENSVVINPGFRWAHNFASGLQIVPGIAFPVEVGRAGRGNWGVFFYLSFEHPFGKRSSQ
jgi:hypothetical protein